MVSFVVANNATINIVIHGIVAAIILPLLVHLLYKLLIDKPQQAKKKHDMEPRLKKLTCLFSLFFVPQLIANLFTEIYSDAHHPKQRRNWNITMNVFYLLVNVCLYLVIIQRYHITFKDSAYSSTKGLYIFLIGLIILYFMVYSSFFVVYATKGHWFPAIDAYKIYIFVDIMILSVDVILTFVITCLFWNKLQRLIIDTYRITNNESVLEIEDISSIHRGTINLNVTQQKMIMIATKMVILTLPAMLSSCILWTVSTWSWILNDNDPTAPILPILTNTLHAVLIPLDIITNFLCIYLNFDFTKRLYRCICCGFDKCCLNCCKCITELRIVKEEQREFELSQTRYRLLSEEM